VTVSLSAHRVEREGATFYFCCARCRAKFEEDHVVDVKEGTPC
jgi:YHS domain-containing protein